MYLPPAQLALTTPKSGYTTSTRSTRVYPAFRQTRLGRRSIQLDINVADAIGWLEKKEPSES